jgi:hypothetical protein
VTPARSRPGRGAPGAGRTRSRARLATPPTPLLGGSADPPGRPAGGAIFPPAGTGRRARYSGAAALSRLVGVVDDSAASLSAGHEAGSGSSRRADPRAWGDQRGGPATIPVPSGRLEFGRARAAR